MNSTLPITVLIRSDPMVSHRPAEALRVAIGLSGGEAEKINIVLIDKAPVLVFADPYDFEDGEAIEQHLEAMNEYGMIFNVEETYLQKGTETDFEIQKITIESLASFIRQSRNVLVF